MSDEVTIHDLDSTTVTTHKGRSGVVARVEHEGVLVGYCYSFYHDALNATRYASTEVAYASYPTLKDAVAATVKSREPKPPDLKSGPEYHSQNRWHERKDFE